MALGIGLRLPVILHPQLDMESLFAVALRNKSIADMIRSAASAGEGPVFHIFLPLWSRLSINESWLVLPAAMMNVSGIFVIYVAARRWAGEKAGLMAAFFASTSPFMIHFSVRPRWEDFAIISAALSVYLTFEIMEKRDGKAKTAGYIISTTIAVMSIYYMLFLWAAENLYLVIRRQNIKKWIVCQAGILAVFTIWFTTFLRQVSEWTVPSDKGIFDSLYHTIFGRGSFNILDAELLFFSGAHMNIHADDPASRIVFYGSLFIVLSAAVGMVALWRKKDPAWRAVFYLLVIQAACMFTALFVFYWKNVEMYIKHMSGFAPAHFLLAGIGIYGLRRRSVTIAILCVYLLIITVSLARYYPLMVRPNDFRSVFANMKQREKDSDVMLVYPPFYMHVVDYYYGGSVECHGVPEDHNLITNEFGARNSELEIRRRIASFADHGRIWVLLPRSETERGGLNTLIPDELKKLGYKPEFEKKFTGTVMPGYHGQLVLMVKKQKDRKPLKP